MMGSMFQMTQSRLGIDLEETLMFYFFVHIVCSALDAYFSDNELISRFKILNLINMPSKQVGLQNWCIFELEILLGHHGVERSHRGFKLLTLVDQATCERESLAFKI